MICRSWRDDRGTMSLELVLLAPILIGLLSLMFGLGRMSGVESLVDQAARDAARSATVQNSRGAADQTARQVAEETLEGAPQHCKDTMDIEPRPSANAFLPIFDVDGLSTYQVVVTCYVDLSDLGVFFWPKDVKVSQAFTSPLDKYRGYVE